MLCNPVQMAGSIKFNITKERENQRHKLMTKEKAKAKKPATQTPKDQIDSPHNFVWSKSS